jgi:GT2 family glycosyltransferase
MNKLHIAKNGFFLPEFPKSVFIILLNWNGWRDTVECLKSLASLDYENWQVIVVDNGSTDNSVMQIRAEFPAVVIIEAKKNLGFAGGCNLGIRYALVHGAEFVWLLNNDAIVAPNSLRVFVKKAEADSQIGAVGSPIYSMEELTTLKAWGGGYVSFWLGRSRHFVSAVRDEKIDFITGASMLLRRSALDSVGLLDEEFFMYWEDADYCFRLRKAGWRLAIAEDSKVWHKESASVGKSSVRLDIFFNGSAARFFRKHACIPVVPIFLGIAFRLAKRAMRGDWKRVRAVWAGYRQSEITTRTSSAAAKTL